MTSNSPLSLTDIVENWIKDHPKLSSHFSISRGGDGGFFINLPCTRDNDPIPIIYIDSMARRNGYWLHELNPVDKEYFNKLEKLIVDAHNLPTVGCGIHL